jgi:hypothetical protein
VKYVGASEKSPIESSLTICTAVVDGRMLSALVVLRPKKVFVRRSMLPSASFILVPAEVPWRRRVASGRSSLTNSLSLGIRSTLAGKFSTVWFNSDLYRVNIVGGAACCVASYGMAKTGIEFERLLSSFRWAFRRDLLHTRSGNCIFLARRRNNFPCWLCDVDGLLSTGSRSIDMACCMPTLSLVLATMAFLQYETPPIRGVEGGAMLASSHSLTSLMTPEFGLGE